MVAQPEIFSMRVYTASVDLATRDAAEGVGDEELEEALRAARGGEGDQREVCRGAA